MKTAFALFFIFFGSGLFSQEIYRYNFREGDKFKVEAEIFSESIQTIKGDTQTVKSNQKTEYIFEITGQKNDKFTASVSFTGLFIELNDNGNKIYYSSDSTNNDISEMFSSFTDIKLNYEISADGKIKSLFTLDSLFSDTSDIKRKNVFFQTVEQKIKDVLPVCIRFSDKKIENGKWTVNDTLTRGMFYFTDKSYNTDSVKNNKIFLTEKFKIITDKNALIPMNGVFVSYDMTGGADAEYELNEENKYAEKARINETSAGEVSMRYAKDMMPAFSWKIKIKNTITFKVKKL